MQESVHETITSKENNKIWRNIQREQLNYSANIYFLFSSAILGFNLDFLLNKKEELICESKTILTIALIFILLSLFLYAMFTHNRLKDFRETAGHYKNGKDEDEVSVLTKEIGKRTWLYYDLQRFLLLLGFIFSLSGFIIYIYS